jgi:hypothetical protein
MVLSFGEPLGSRESLAPLHTLAMTLPSGPSFPIHPVELLACAIATQEGYFVAGSPPQIWRNPGDLRFAHQTGASAPISSGSAFPIAMFESTALGITALFRQIWLQVAEGQTVRQIISQWAPPNENNTSVYLENVLHWTGLPADTPVLELLPPLQRLN